MPADVDRACNSWLSRARANAMASGVSVAMQRRKNQLCVEVVGASNGSRPTVRSIEMATAIEFSSRRIVLTTYRDDLDNIQLLTNNGRV